ncbi:MAG TPA: hypothetical protein VGJ60_07230 [Chloroflexota bacterium]
MTSHFSLGNSSRGPIGFCARVDAGNKSEAVEKLKEYIEDLNREVSVSSYDDDIEYFEVYLNPDVISTRHIDEVGG